MPKIRVVFTPDGRVSVDGVDFVGSKCQEMIEPILAAAGLRKKGDPILKPEYFTETDEETARTKEIC